MFVSIIVPVFNSEKYLSFCLDSVLSQDFCDFELLLIDDCSTDSSVAICKDYERKYPQVRLIQRDTNGGVGASRNTGLTAARGEYITFLDNDDYWLENNPLQSLYDFVNAEGHPDIVTYQTLDYWSASKTLSEPSLSDHARAKLASCVSRNELNSYLIESRLYCSAVWSKLIKHDYIETHQIKFPDGRRNEDSYFSLNLLYYKPSITFFDSPFYVWRRASSNSQSAKGVKRSDVEDLLWILVSYEKNGMNFSLDNESLHDAMAFASYLYVILLSYLDLVSDEDMARLKNEAYSLSHMLESGSNPRVKMTYVFSKVLGIKMTSHLLGALMAREKKMVTSR